MRTILYIIIIAILFSFAVSPSSHPRTGNYYIVIYTTGKAWDKKKEFWQQPYFNAHSNHLSSLRKKGVITMGSRYSDKGMIVITAPSLAEAASLIQSDSAVVFKTFSAEIHEMDVFYEGSLTISKPDTMKKVTGIGGVFFKCKDPQQMRDWYSKNLGLVTNEYGSLFEFRLSDDPNQKGYLQWSPFTEKTKYFEPSKKEFMINYRVENLAGLVKELKDSGVTVLDEIQEFEYGKFVHIMDPEGNKIELWEPVDTEFTRSYEGKTTK
jgi:predicted enzyme related to lactoylglutathione lyase/uncharacterized protein YciI